MQNIVKIASLVLLSICFVSPTFAQKKKEKTEEKKENPSALLKGLEFRSIGPAFMSGRISDIVIHPNNENVWYVGVASGGVWKTENSGTSWSSLFEGQGSFAIGCITLDPQNPEVVWVGTGENNGGRHISYGDGIYKSEDGGKTWKNMGLKASEHLSKIIIHPTNSNIMWVASQGPLWSKGGERGVYKSTDGGNTWNRTLGDAEWVGATDLLIDPRNPDLLYAATWQRQRTVAGYMGGGPGTAIYKSNDGGENWTKLKNGLPSSNMGKIGLAMSPQKPDVLYAAIELDRRTGGVYKSENQGASWTKMSDATAGGTGPHYYQELYVSPHNYDEIYLANNYMLVSFDGGKNFKQMNESEKHVDNHAVAFKATDPNYMLVGCDGGLYETFDHTENWKYISNLPVTQFYKIAVDDAEPFYYVYGGTQDNSTQGGPSRTMNQHGIQNSDWFIVVGGDGHQPATEPGNPNVVYGQSQQGYLSRHDRKTGENVFIQPQPELGEKYERFNWDAPILVSPHNPKKIYHASQRVWMSEDRGDSWTPISGDLTKQIDRIQTPFYGKKQKWDNPWDIYAMSNYSTITSLSESPKQAGLIYAGTDDGLIQVTEDGGKNWRKVDFSKIKGLPLTAFVNDIKADLHDVNVVYAVFDNHKYGDYAPYLYKSSDKGKTWTSISNGVAERTLLWRIVQDHEKKELMFLGTEFGVYFTQDAGANWMKLEGGMPTISVRDLAIQKRENDLIAGTFGRGIYVLDDYSALRTLDIKKDAEAQLFTPRKGDWYTPSRPLGGGKKASQGDNYFMADNPPFGVQFSYFLKENYKSKADLRKENEKKAEKAGEEVAAPAYSILDEEKKSIDPKVWLFISDKSGNIIRRLEAKNKKGLNRIAWDYSSESNYTVTPKNVDSKRSGPRVGPGTYTAQLYKQIEGEYSPIAEKVEFQVELLQQHSMANNTIAAVTQHWEKVNALQVEINNFGIGFNEAQTETKLLLESYSRASTVNPELNKNLVELQKQILDLELKFRGSKSRQEVGEKNEYPTISNYLGAASAGSTYGPTKAHIKYLGYAEQMLKEMKEELSNIEEKVEAYEEALEKMGAPGIED